MELYYIRVYNLIGLKQPLKTHEPFIVDSLIELTKSEAHFMRNGTYETYLIPHSEFYVSETPEGMLYDPKGHLPYTANVIEDLPTAYKKLLKSRIYSNSILKMQKHGGYLQFYHADTGMVLRIAMNSYYYKPIKK